MGASEYKDICSHNYNESFHKKFGSFKSSANSLLYFW